MISKCSGKPSKGVGDDPEDKAEENVTTGDLDPKTEVSTYLISAAAFKLIRDSWQPC